MFYIYIYNFIIIIFFGEKGRLKSQENTFFFWGWEDNNQRLESKMIIYDSSLNTNVFKYHS